jgi:hypothetical protein
MSINKDYKIKNVKITTNGCNEIYFDIEWDGDNKLDYYELRVWESDKENCLELCPYAEREQRITVKDFNFIKNQPLNFAISVSIGAILRFVCHVLSGVFAFGEYALDAGASNLLVYSLAYNSFVFIDLALVIVVGVMLFSSKTFIKELEKKN